MNKIKKAICASTLVVGIGIGGPAASVVIAAPAFAGPCNSSASERVDSDGMVIGCKGNTGKWRLDNPVPSDNPAPEEEVSEPYSPPVKAKPWKGGNSFATWGDTVCQWNKAKKDC